MRGNKKSNSATNLTDWPWVNPFYTFNIPFAAADIKSIVIDPAQGMADVDRSNNVYPFALEVEMMGEEK